MTNTLGRNGRRRGQALLMAVLLMVFAALLGSTFVTVVALNLSQTAREEQRTDAQAAVSAGMSVINSQLVAQGEKWRPEQISPPPAPLDQFGNPDPSYSLYYTDLDKAQGWARTTPRAAGADTIPADAANGNTSGVGGDWDDDGTFDAVKDDWAKLEYYKNHPAYDVANNSGHVYVKFPDPRQPTSQNTPSYLAEVRQLQDASDGNDKISKLKITIIGLNQDNPLVFVRGVAYKDTSSNGNPFSFARFDSNYDSNANKFMATSLTSAFSVSSASDVSVTLSVADATFMQPGQLLLVHREGYSGTGANMPVVVQSVNSVAGTVTGTVHSSGSSFSYGFPVASPVRVVSQLAESLQLNEFDADGNGVYGESQNGANYETTVTPMHYLAGDTSPGTRPRLGGYYFNGGLYVDRNSNLELSSTNQDYLQVAGPLTIQQYAGAAYSDGPAASPSYYTASASTQMVRFNTTVNSTDPTMGNVRAVRPPELDSGTYNRYYELTRYADVSKGSQYGYGPGVYIDNSDDVEKVVDGSPTGYRQLGVSEMQRMWQRKSFAAQSSAQGNVSTNLGVTGSSGYGPGVGAFRLSWPRHIRTATTTNAAKDDTYTYPMTAGSLEQQGVRGWISPNRFKPRGVLVEFHHDATDTSGDYVVITRDDRSESAAVTVGGTQYSMRVPDVNKAWKSYDGSPITNPGQRTYRMKIDLRGSPHPSDPNYNAQYGHRWFGAEGAEVALDPNTGPVAINGVICAEGNIRVRGTIPAADAHDFTLVSLHGNIYVEGTVTRASTNANRVALLARKNVVLNPTQFVAQLDGVQDTDIGDLVASSANAAIDGTAGTTQLTVSGTVTDPASGLPLPAGNFLRVGDYIRPGNCLDWVRINSLSSDALGNWTLNLDQPLDANVTSTDTPAPVLRVLHDPDIVNDTTTHESFYRMAPDDVLARDFKMDGSVPSSATGNSMYVALRHAGERKVAMTIDHDILGHSKDFYVKYNTSPGYFMDNNSTDTNGSVEKRLQLDRNSGLSTFYYDLLNIPLPSGQTPGTRGDDTSHTMDKLFKWFTADVPSGPYASDTSHYAYGEFTISTTVPSTGSGSTPSTYAWQGSLPPRRFAAMGSTPPNGTSTPVTSMPANVPWSVSVGAFWPDATTNANAVRQALQMSYAQKDPQNANNAITFPIGSGLSIRDASATAPGNYLSLAQTGSTQNFNDRRYWDDVLTTSDSFYQSGTSQASLQWQSRQRIQMNNNSAASNTYIAPSPLHNVLVLRRDPMDLTFDPMADSATASQRILPFYRLGGVKLEFGPQTYDSNGAFSTNNNSSAAFTPVPVTVRATIFAQEGSWFVIPTPASASTAAWSGSPTSADYTAHAAATHYRRMNYQISVIGNIVQNVTPTGRYDYDSEEDGDGYAQTGAMSRWLDTVAYPQLIQQISPGGSKYYMGCNWAPITYYADPISAADQSKMALPVAPDIAMTS